MDNLIRIILIVLVVFSILGCSCSCKKVENFVVPPTDPDSYNHSVAIKGIFDCDDECTTAEGKDFSTCNVNGEERLCMTNSEIEDVCSTNILNKREEHICKCSLGDTFTPEYAWKRVLQCNDIPNAETISKNQYIKMAVSEPTKNPSDKKIHEDLYDKFKNKNDNTMNKIQFINMMNSLGTPISRSQVTSTSGIASS